MDPHKKPWPADAVILIGSPLGQEIRDDMDDPTVVTCRDCKGDVCVDTTSIATVAALPSRGPRPVDYLCIPCAVLYDFGSITEAHDPRGLGLLRCTRCTRRPLSTRDGLCPVCYAQPRLKEEEPCQTTSCTPSSTTAIGGSAAGT